MKLVSVVLSFVAALTLLTPHTALAEEQLLSCEGAKTMHFRTDSEMVLEGQITLIVNGTTLKTDYGVSAELSNRDDFSMTWRRTVLGELQYWELNTISGLLVHGVSNADEDGGHEPLLAHLYYCRRVETRIIE